VRALSYILLLLISVSLLPSCSRNKDIVTARSYHRMVSKYNILFNGEQALIKAEASMKSQHKDDFDKLLKIYPGRDEKGAGAVKPDLERAIEKGTKVITNHTMMIENRQRNIFIDDAYLLIGKARYYNREYMLALETFNYTIQEFRKPEIRMHAELWAAKTETALGNFVAAKERFERLYSDRVLSKHLNADVYAAFAELEIDQDRYLNAYQLLSQGAEKTKKKDEELRWLYICGQLQSSLGNDYEASQLFLKVIKKGPPYDLLFNAQLWRARSYDVDLMDPSKAYDELKKMLKDDKNFDNRDRIYYVMAEVANKLDEWEDRENFLKTSIKSSTINQIQKALSFLWLAEINFQDKLYENAQAYYDSTFQTLPPDHIKYPKVALMRKSLGKLVGNLKTIALQDSLQLLALKSPADQLAAVEEIIEELKEAEAEAERAENDALDNLAFNGLSNSDGGGLNGLAGMGSANTEFYFYNPTLRSSGVGIFVTKWANRKLEDNWRRGNKTATQGSITEAQEANNSEADVEEGEKEVNPKHDPQTYLANIPNDSGKVAASHMLIQNALLDNSIIYKEEIKDLKAAAESVLELLKRYTDYVARDRAWYILYRIYTVAENETETAKYRQLILSTYPTSEYAYLILNEGKEELPVNEKEAKEKYHAAYRAYESKSYRSALSLSNAGFVSYEDSRYGAKFLLLRAYAEGALQRKDDLLKTLQKVLERYPRTDESTEAKKILDALSLGMDAEGEGKGSKEEGQFSYKTDFSNQHRYILVVANKGGPSANQLNIRLANFNSKYYPNDKLLVKSVLMGLEKNLIMVSGLANKVRAEQFYKTLNNEKYLEKELLSVDFKQFVISNANFAEFYKRQDTEGYLLFFNSHYLKKAEKR
jgi:tetratricopeptide (TPR) repeat protein